MQGHEGWDDYADYYDWENAQTVGRRDIAFWSAFAQMASSSAKGRSAYAKRASAFAPRTKRATARQAVSGNQVLELGCGTGRVAIPVAKTGARVIGIDRSESMLSRGQARVRRAKIGGRVTLLRGDIRHLPFPDQSFPLVMAPYGILQSLLDEKVLTATLNEVQRVLTPGGTFGLELVADLPAWDEYSNKVTFRSPRGPHGKPIVLVESVKQDRRNHITRFEQEFIEGRGKGATRRKFSLAFRTVSVPQMVKRLEKAGFEAFSLLGDYQGGPWDMRADVWIILARAKPRQR